MLDGLSSLRKASHKLILLFSVRNFVCLLIPLLSIYGRRNGRRDWSHAAVKVHNRVNKWALEGWLAVGCLKIFGLSVAMPQK